MQTNAPDANTASSPVPDNQPARSSMDEFYAALSGADDQLADSSTAEVPGDQDPGLEPEGEAEADAEAKPDGEATPDQKKADEEVNPKTAKRIERLLQERAQVREELSKAKEQFATREAQYKVALRKAVADLSAYKAKLGEYGEDFEGPEAQLAALKGKQQVQTQLAQERQAIMQRIAQEREAALVGDFRAQFQEAISETLEDFPQLSEAQLKAAIKAHAQANADVTIDNAGALFRELAQKLDDELLAKYEARVLERHRPKLNAPNPISSRGTVSVSGRPLTLEEIIADQEARKGTGWGR